jgi:hypothetical protein
MYIGVNSYFHTFATLYGALSCAAAGERVDLLSPPGDNMSDSQPMRCGQILTLSGFRHYDWTLTFDISDILIGWRQNCRVLF